MKRIYAEVYVKHNGKTIWVNKFMRLILSGESKRLALRLSSLSPRIIKDLVENSQKEKG